VIAAVGLDRGEPAAVEAKPVGPRVNNLAARAQKVLEQPFDELQRVRGVSVLAHEQAADIVARKAGSSWRSSSASNSSISTPFSRRNSQAK